LINAYESRRTEMEALADAGLEVARARLNADRDLYPDEGYKTLENGQALVDAAGAGIPGVKRYVYAGPVGQTSGQFGVFGSIISVVESGNTRVVRRGDIAQASFARFAYFTDVEPSNIAFGGGDMVSGPVHSNDVIKIYNSGASFRGPGSVTTARTISGRQYATFSEGYQENVPRIPLPTLADLTKLRGYAEQGGAAFTAPSGGTAFEARMRIEFLTIDLNGDGRHDGDEEGFFRVYRGTGATWWVTASRNGNGWPASENCGVWTNDSTFVLARDLGGNTSYKINALRNTNVAKCYLGGSDSLTNGFVPSQNNRGDWVRRGFALNGNLPQALRDRDDLDFLFPLGHGLNPNFKGVIHVTGRVAISGVLRGRVTLAATDRIIIADDIVYVSEGNSCEDILGLFGGADISVADNLLNSPQSTANGEPFRSYDSTPSEFINGVILTLNTFNVENYDGGPNAERCQNEVFGRGCLFLTGGIIQRTRGAVGTSGGTGYLKRYTYDACAASAPPPYFPTTGHFDRSSYYEVNPVGFSVSTFFEDRQ
ncbi:MAG TPA: hypothetical protein VFZ20_03075, partial [Longimicrobium sp.]